MPKHNQIDSPLFAVKYDPHFYFGEGLCEFKKRQAKEKRRAEFRQGFYDLWHFLFCLGYCLCFPFIMGLKILEVLIDGMINPPRNRAKGL